MGTSIEKINLGDEREPIVLEVASGDLKATATRSGAVSFLINGGIVLSRRLRIAVADLAAGVTLLPAVAGLQYRMVACKAIAIGGDADTSTDVRVRATQAGSAVSLVEFTTTDLDRSEVHYDGEGTTGVVLADGDSYIQNDANTAITVDEAGGATGTATSIDIIISYTLES